MPERTEYRTEAVTYETEPCSFCGVEVTAGDAPDSAPEDAGVLTAVGVHHVRQNSNGTDVALDGGGTLTYLCPDCAETRFEYDPNSASTAAMLRDEHPEIAPTLTYGSQRYWNHIGGAFVVGFLCTLVLLWIAV